MVTIDSSQDLEKDVVIILVDDSPAQNEVVPQLLRIALTRAKKALYICGDLNQSMVSLMDIF